MCDNSTLWKSKVVFTETDMLQKQHSEVETVSLHFTLLSGTIRPETGLGLFCNWNIKGAVEGFTIQNMADLRITAPSLWTVSCIFQTF